MGARTERTTRKGALTLAFCLATSRCMNLGPSFSNPWFAPSRLRINLGDLGLLLALYAALPRWATQARLRPWLPYLAKTLEPLEVILLFDPALHSVFR
jgi:hypothetical protein